MDWYFRSFYVVKEFLRKDDRVVYLAKARDPIPGYPIEFVVKEFIGKEPQEASIHKQLQNSYSYILRVFDTWTDANKYYMSIEYCEDGDLHTYLQLLNGQPLGFQYILHIALQLSDTVSFMHQQKICHRDIKPLNIYMTNNRQAYKLADFGEAKRVEENATGFHTIAGTPYYMSPEQKENFQNKVNVKVNPYRDDIWALGRTFIEISLGKLCPETFDMNTSALHHYIDQKFKYFGYNPKFTVIVKSMMVDIKDFSIKADQVRGEILALYNELYNPSQVFAKVEEHKVTSPRERKSDVAINNPSVGAGLVGTNEGQFEFNKMNGHLKPINEDSSSYYTPSSSSESSSSGFEKESQLVNEKFRLSTPDIQFSPILKSQNLFTQEKKEELPSPILPERNFPNYSQFRTGFLENSGNLMNPNTQKNIVKNIKEVNGCGKISIATERFKEITSINAEKPSKPEIPIRSIAGSINDPKKITETLKIDPELSSINPNASSKNLKNFSMVSENLDILPPINIHPGPIPKRNKTICIKCNIEIEDNPVILPCKDPYHQNCFVSYYNKKIEKLERRSEPLKCFRCNYSISFEFFNHVKDFSDIIKKLIDLQIYSSTNFSCPICKKDLNSNMLSRKFKAKTKFCSTCKYKFCTFCSVKGSHRFYCDLLKDFKKNTFKDSNYIQK